MVELWAGKGAEIKYSTVQNWYAGDEQGRGGIYNFVTKRGICQGARSHISWTQVCATPCAHAMLHAVLTHAAHSVFGGMELPDCVSLQLSAAFAMACSDPIACLIEMLVFAQGSA